MMCDSASLPESIHRRWYEITGHHRLERYGMTECGIALSNPSKGERIPAHAPFTTDDRQSMDIIECSGHKVSALYIERILLEHTNISECSVIDVDDPTLGQKIDAIIVTKSLNTINDLRIDTVREYSKKNIYQIIRYLIQ
ncbi:unnamed protein product [Rotaria magnacalcarata]|uniref:AMP-binding enzyme C-terminal domain-containing protein n=1 Tax=Rotaria magnacalcarata TaxID=392030 RepID=A0A819TT31_9BILA|nr:unnamed protein product [Rotaria magnacalcarata]CAF4170519.1 unnamed protein product [Rotaria magnacalcarata]